MNLYAAPGTPPTATPSEDDIAAAVPPLMARIAGGTDVLAGGIVGLTGAQTLLIVTVRGSMSFAPYALGVLGVAQLVVGAMVFRARAWAVVLSIASSGMLALTSTVWLFFSFGHGLFSLIALGSPIVSVAAVALSIVALGPAQRATAARARLKAQGLNLGI